MSKSKLQQQGRKIAIAELEKMLRRRAMTAAQIALATGCSRPTAHGRLRALEADLRKNGSRIVRGKVREGAKGPLSKTYAVASR